MGYIKEPDGVDLIIKSKPLTEKQKKAISEFIKAEKERLRNRKTKTRIANKTSLQSKQDTEISDNA